MNASGWIFHSLIELYNPRGEIYALERKFMDSAA